MQQAHELGFVRRAGTAFADQFPEAASDFIVLGFGLDGLRQG
jgi:type VI protein secretion system component VasA